MEIIEAFFQYKNGFSQKVAEIMGDYLYNALVPTFEKEAQKLGAILIERVKP